MQTTQTQTKTCKRLERALALVVLVVAGSMCASAARASETRASIDVSVSVLSSCTVSTQASGADASCHATAAKPRIEAARGVRIAGIEGTFDVTTLQF